jgi:Cu(I)/Ag(I) efflux system membrane fusion protein
VEKAKAARARDIQAALKANAAEGPEPGLDPIITRTDTGVIVNPTSSNFQQRIDRLHLLGMSDQQIHEIRTTRQVPTRIKIVAPADGTVLSRDVRPGLKFDRFFEWFRIADLRRVWVMMDVTGAEVQHVRAGQEVKVRVPDSGKTFVARVSDVAPQFDAETRTFKVRLEADNPGEVLRPDMFVDVELPAAPSSTLSVPVDAVVDTGMKRTVYIESAPGVFEPRAVETGWRRGGRVEILSGISAGERIVTSATFLLDSETRMRPAVATLADPEMQAVPAEKGGTKKDPICGMNVDPEAARSAGRTLERDGDTHYFCSDSCREQYAKKTPSGTHVH